MATFVHPCKCVACGLHFNVYSWKEGWGDSPEDVIFCPECGTNNHMLKYQGYESLDQIYMHVPGPANRGIAKLPT